MDLFQLHRNIDLLGAFFNAYPAIRAHQGIVVLVIARLENKRKRKLVYHKATNVFLIHVGHTRVVYQKVMIAYQDIVVLEFAIPIQSKT